MNTEITGASIGIIEEKVSEVTSTNRHQKEEDESNFRPGCRQKGCSECLNRYKFVHFFTRLVMFVLKRFQEIMQHFRMQTEIQKIVSGEGIRAFISHYQVGFKK